MPHANSSERLRIDALTGCSNLLGFFEACLASPRGHELLPGLRGQRDFRIGTPYSALLVVVLRDLDVLSEQLGQAHASSAIRWLGILLLEETGRPVYRLGVFEFAVLLDLKDLADHTALLARMGQRLTREARLLGFPGFPANIVLLLNDQPETQLDGLMIEVVGALAYVEREPERHHLTVRISELRDFGHPPLSAGLDVTVALGRIAQEYIVNVLALGHSLDQARQDADTDAVSKLPNMRAAMDCLEQTLERAKQSGQPFSVLLIDGDNLRAANLISYAAGDEIIRAMGAVFKQHLRPGDHVARWRTGDEFLFVLPSTPLPSATVVAERIRLAVKTASQAWKAPVTISVGIASYPSHGDDLAVLLEKAELANKQAKQQGKDRVIPAT